MEDSSQPPDRDNQATFLVRGMRYMAVASQFAISLAIFGFIGAKADERYGWSPWGLLVGILLGMSIGLWSMLKQLQRLDKQDGKP